MTVHMETEGVTIREGDCIDVMRTMPDGSVDAVVTDPPYGIDFMGREWDTPGKMLGVLATGDEQRGAFAYGGTHSRGYAGHDGRQFQAWCEQWAAEAYRLLKPGGHLLAFGGTRTYHRLAAGIEDAGFEIRDSIAWLYGSGFPKSLDVSKAIDRRRDWTALPKLQGKIRAARQRLGWSQSEAARRAGIIGEGETLGGGGFMWFETGMRVPTAEQYPRLKAALLLDDECDAVFEAAEREVLSERVETVKDGPGWAGMVGHGRFAPGEKRIQETAPATAAAREWAGWGTALKPAFEPVVVARKPLEGTVAANVLAHGTGALNIDANRLGSSGGAGGFVGARGDTSTVSAFGDGLNGAKERDEQIRGRWPANVILDESQADALDRMAPDTGAAAPASGPTLRNPTGKSVAFGARQGLIGDPSFHGDRGGASRFFYSPKASTSERPTVDGVAHPTVKPVELMRWLCRLVTPRGGTVLEPFAGSGTTVEAAVLEGFRCIAIEREPEYVPLIMQRVSKPHAVALDFGDWDGGAA